jgi:transaldolase/glucose-6-phosphate isomerase
MNIPVIVDRDAASILQARERGQSIWLDDLSRGLLASGRLAEFVSHAGVCGVTTNPAIFEKAIASSGDYEPQLRELLGTRPRPSLELYEALAIDDVRQAADLLEARYRESGGRDGYVSLEVQPALAHDARATIAEARRLAATVARPNLMIKVPATPAGLQAITELLAGGISVNATLIFSVKVWGQVWDAFRRGLAERLASGGEVDTLASVASFFVSRIDTEVDRRLTELAAGASRERQRELSQLQGRAALATAQLVYHDYQQAQESPDWLQLLRRGARPQRLLWASTTCRLPGHGIAGYAESLVQRGTVATLSLDTLLAFAAGELPPPAPIPVEAAAGHWARLAALGIDREVVADELLRDGIRRFAEAFERMLAAISTRRSELLGERSPLVR